MAKELQNSTKDKMDQLNLKFFIAHVETFVAGYKHKGFYFPINFLEGVQVDFQRLAEWTSLDTLEDYRDLVARCLTIPQASRYFVFTDYITEVIEMLRTAMAEGRTNHLASMAGVVDQCRAHTNIHPADTVFFTPFANLTGVYEKEVRMEALACIELWVQPGFATLAKFLEEEYLPATRSAIAASTLGKGFYQVAVQPPSRRLASPSTPAPTSRQRRSMRWASRRWRGSRRKC